ncbi:GatB/YqeY domain-containing protein [Nitrosococcus wardiae]|uniref:GatB/YqeY domain-containing protein n=2 Tax=Nitrosococcus wardiae TaxID=1814290 RepID=A0A4P7BUV3_9GAMM|nr:GatB/YqeY domain-containing protein [Nitrosococcus wardiae]
MVTEMGSLKTRLQEEVKAAMRAKDKARLGVLRMVMATLKQFEVDTREPLEDTQIIALLEKMLKQRREALEQYEAAGREDLAEKERFELEVIQSYMPTPLSEAEIEQLIEEAIRQSQAATIKDMGKVMGILKPRIQGRADMAVVSAKVKSRLTAAPS